MMHIEFNEKDIKENRRLRNCLDSGVIDVNGLRSFLDGLDQKIKLASGPPDPGKKTRAKKKHARVNKYKMMREENIHGKRKIPD